MPFRVCRKLNLDIGLLFAMLDVFRDIFRSTQVLYSIRSDPRPISRKEFSPAGPIPAPDRWRKRAYSFQCHSVQ